MGDKKRDRVSGEELSAGFVLFTLVGGFGGIGLALLKSLSVSQVAGFGMVGAAGAAVTFLFLITGCNSDSQ